MRPLSQDEIHSYLLNILRVVADFCDRNGLRYSIAYGTLLGASGTKDSSHGTTTST